MNMNIILPDNLDIQALFADSEIDFNDPAIFPKERTAEYKEWQERCAAELATAAERSRIYRKENKEKCYAAVNKWCDEHPEQIKDIKRRSRERHREIDKAYRERNREHIAARSKEYEKRPEVRERRKEISRKYRERHRIEVNAKAAEYRAANRELCNARTRAWHARKLAEAREGNSDYCIKRLEYNRRYIAEHREELNAKKRAKRAEQKAAKAAQQDKDKCKDN